MLGQAMRTGLGGVKRSMRPRCQVRPIRPSKEKRRVAGLQCSFCFSFSKIPKNISFCLFICELVRAPKMIKNFV
jgi:hypothetical protein